jgi:cysteinyl-tRNA synthetase
MFRTPTHLEETVLFMQVFNSLTRKTGEFAPNEPGKVLMYVCGLTPYDSAHIGHARTYVAFDLVKRLLTRRGFKVFHIQNITDVEDKIIRRCRETGADPAKLTGEIHSEALEMFDRLNIIRADVYPKVTGHIPEIIALVRTLLEKGFAYETATGVYFDVSRFKGYGSLSGQDMGEIEAGSRKEVDETKGDPADFALWKKTSNEIIEFDSPWGRGRPGWHIECSAMSLKYAGATLDIHGGARDLIFPHHENEIAQSEAATGRQFCRCWMHTGFLTVEGEKMSKSLGNFITLKQSLSRFSPNALRMFYLQAHYRSPLDYDEDALQAAGESVERIFNSLGLMREIEEGRMDAEDAEFRKETDALVAAFHSALDSDFDTPAAFAALFGLLRSTNTHVEKGAVDHAQVDRLARALEEMIWILGFREEKAGVADKGDALKKLAVGFGISEADPEKIVDALVSLREECRKNKDYKKADEIRSALSGLGISLEDKKSGAGPRRKVK